MPIVGQQCFHRLPKNEISTHQGEWRLDGGIQLPYRHFSKFSLNISYIWLHALVRGVDGVIINLVPWLVIASSEGSREIYLV